MDEMSSVEFRKRYAKLTQPTNVTVLGRTIGVWFPGVVDESGIVGVLSAEAERMGGGTLSVVQRPPTDVPFSTRPFTPVPKAALKRHG